MNIVVSPIATVRNSRPDVSDVFWGSIISEIVLDEGIPAEAFAGIGAFSHLEIIFFFDQVAPGDIVYSGYPRGNAGYPLMGIFGQRKKNRPNRLGLATVEPMEHMDRTITVRYLDEEI